MRTIGKILLYFFVILVVGIGAFLITSYFVWSDHTRPIPTGLDYYLFSQFLGQPANYQTLPDPGIPQHPFMATNGTNNMHSDSYASDTYLQAGPIGINPKVTSSAKGLVGGECASVNFDRKGRIITVSGDFSGMRLLLLDPETLDTLASYTLPQRPSIATGDIRTIVKDTSGGAYFFLDHLDRPVIATSDGTIKVFSLNEGTSNEGESNEGIMDYTWSLVQNIDLYNYLNHQPSQEDSIITTLPDWQNRYWFVTRQGCVGYVHPNQPTEPKMLVLENEEIQNSFAVDEDGVYIVSDHALYMFEADISKGKPNIIWCETYDRGYRTKPGMIYQGSGTSPTLLGSDYIAIADNAEPWMHVLIYKRHYDVNGKRLVCAIPVFECGKSATENTLIGLNNSILVENNFGYDIFPTMNLGARSESGISRIDFDENQNCEVIWTSNEISQNTVPKLSIGNGLVYVYTKNNPPNSKDELQITKNSKSTRDQYSKKQVIERKSKDLKPNFRENYLLPFSDAYYLTALDWETGETVFKILVGTGMLYDNNWAPITIGPSGAAYVGMLNGLVKIEDQPAPTLPVNFSDWFFYHSYWIPLIAFIVFGAGAGVGIFFLRKMLMR